MTLRQRIHVVLLGAVALAVAIAEENISLQITPTGTEQYKALGDNLFLTCSATGGSPHLISELQWLDPQGAPIPKTNRMHSEKSSPDKTLLFIKNIKEEDTGTYKCVAKYAESQELSADVTLSTFMDITWKDAPEEQHLVIDSNGKIKCDVQAQPQPTVDWTKDGQPFKPNDRCINENDGILCRPVLQADEGHYTCRARVTSTGRMSERNIRVEVDTPPKIDSLQTEFNAIEDGKVTMTCSATGKPIPTVSWVKKDTVDLSKEPGYTVDERAGVLIIEQVSRDDHGMFTCVAKNIAGEDMKETKLNVVSKPKIKEFNSITAEKHGKAQLVCRVYAEPLPEIIITKKDSQRMFEANQPYTDERIIIELLQEGFDMIFTVTIKETVDEDDGFYNCDAKNIGGITSATAHLTVEHAPTFDEKEPMLVKSWEHNTINLTCVARSIPNATIEWYSETRDISLDPNIRTIGSGPVSVLEVKTTGNIYYMEYRCKATNKLGVKELIFMIQQAFAPKEIKQADVKTHTATTVSFLLVGPDDNGGMPVTHYIVEYTEDKGETKQRSWPVADHAYILDKLVPEKKYTFKFAASNAVGRGLFTQTKSLIMPRKRAPEEPQIIVATINRPVMSPYSDRITIQWKIPADNGEPIDHFQIVYTSFIDGAIAEGNSVVLNQGPASTQIELTNLHPNTKYKVEVRAHNVIGFSYPGQIDIKTAQGTVHDQQQLQKSQVPPMEIIIGIVIALIVIVLIVIDASCYFTNKCGILMCLCVHVCGKEHDPEKEKDGIIGSGKNNDKEKEALKDSMDNDAHGKSPHGSRSSIAKDSPV